MDREKEGERTCKRKGRHCRRFSEGFLEVACSGFYREKKGFLEGGSEKGASRRYSEGRTRPFVEHDPPNSRGP